MHNGDFSILEKSLEEIRQILKLPQDDFLFISVFDYTPIKRYYRFSQNVGPMNNVERQNIFFQDLIKLSESNPKIRFIYKPKRLKKAVHEEIPELEKFLKHPSVISCEFNFDPILPMLASDFCITTAMTSPSIMSWYFGREGYFYDPTSVARYFRFKDLDNLMIYKFEDLEKKVLTFRKKDNGDIKGIRKSLQQKIRAQF